MTNKKLTYCLLATLATLFAGCWQKSLHPFYQEKDLSYDTGLVGVWSEKQDDEKKKDAWTFSAAGENKYKLNILDGETTVEFEARLFNLGGDQYLDLLSAKRSMSEIPAHHLLKVARAGDTLKIHVLNTDWVQKWLKANPGKMDHLRLTDPDHPEDRDKDELVLTARTPELQKFIMDHRQDADFFNGDGETLTRHPQVLAKP